MSAASAQTGNGHSLPQWRTYFGVILWRQSCNGPFGYRLPWIAYVNGIIVAADTLVGIKSLVRDEIHREGH